MNQNMCIQNGELDIITMAEEENGCCLCNGVRSSIKSFMEWSHDE